MNDPAPPGLEEGNRSENRTNLRAFGSLSVRPLSRSDSWVRMAEEVVRLGEWGVAAELLSEARPFLRLTHSNEMYSRCCYLQAHLAFLEGHIDDGLQVRQLFVFFTVAFFSFELLTTLYKKIII